MTERVLICGDRNWARYDIDATDEEIATATRQQIALYRFVASLPEGTLVVEGDAKGADRMAGRFARDRGLNTLVFPAHWQKYGRAAGPIRNKKMLTEGKPTRVVAFHDNIEHSKGTLNMIAIARKAGVPTEVMTSERKTEDSNPNV